MKNRDRHLATMTPDQAGRYPNWSMVISVDSATMMNKVWNTLKRVGCLTPAPARWKC
ncbi:hypothetical protein ACLBR5_27000 [Escherichia coli]